MNHAIRWVGVGIAVVAFACGCGKPAPTPAIVAPPDFSALVEVKVSDVQYNPLTQQHIIQVESVAQESAGTLVHLIVGEQEAAVLNRKLARQSFARPMTHDLTMQLLKDLGGAVRHVVVEDLREGIFLGRLYFTDRAGAMHSADSRASDAIILGVSSGTKIHFSRKVVEEAGIRPPKKTTSEGPAI